VIALALVLVAQLSSDTVYATPALRDFVARASVQNRDAPLSLAGYTAKVETELALILRDSIGRETVAQLEQIAARATWERTGEYELHVQGYRSQSAGAPYSALTFARMYTVPTLYGNRLVLGMNDGVAWTKRDSAAWKNRWKQDSVARRPRLRTVHPLASDRELYYRFTGGDTVATLHARDRLIHVVRVHVEPVRDLKFNFLGFRGELDFDADRHQLVRMRGRLMSISAQKDGLISRGSGAVAVAYMEFENAEVNGRYWLPAYQRSEFQAQMALLGDVRPVFRLQSRFRSYDTRDTVVTLTELNSGTAVPLAPPTRAWLTYASADSVSRFGDWAENLGTTTTEVTSEDFNDLAPDVWKTTGKARLDYWPRRTEDILRFNRVEGLYTGISTTLRFRDAFPGLRATAMFGWAWAEQTARGSAAVTLDRAHWISSARIERALESTNDFQLAFESGRSIWPIFGSSDNQDYVDRWVAAGNTTRVIGNVDRAMLSGEIAYVEDHVVARNVAAAPLTGTAYLENRGIWPGRYGRAQATLEFHPRVGSISISPGLGATLRAEAAAGDLDWQRLEARVTARRYWHGLVLASSVSGGAVFGDSMPPQALYELGGYEHLASYDYKEFAGDRAALGTGLIAYHLPVLKKPMRIRMFVVPGLSPGLGVGIQGGWTEISSDAARRAVLALGGDGITPISRATDGVRATTDVRFTLLSGALGFGFARAIDHPDGWKPFFGFGLSF